MAICNATGNLSETVRQVQAEAFARWEFNHTSQWIDATFASTYREEGAMYAKLAASLPELVPAEQGLGEEELAALRNASLPASDGRE